MIVLGLTGSIGMGKSTTAQFFRDRCVQVFDADAAVHELYRTKAALPVEERFPGTLKDGDIDRSVLAKALAKDPKGFSDLEQIIHPLVRQAEIQFIDQNRKMGAQLVVLDIPLLFESGGDALCDKILVVTATEAVQKERVLARPEMTQERFDQLLTRQMSDAKKRERADYLLFSDRGLDAARQQVDEIMALLLK